MRKRFFKRILSFFLVLTLLFTSDSLFLCAFSVEEPLDGVGIYNHVMTSEDSVNTKYIVKFYRHKLREDGYYDISFPNEIQVGESKYLTPNTDEELNDFACIYLDKNERIDFSQSEAFNDFITENQIDTIVIYYEHEYLDQQETSVLYSEEVQRYDFWRTRVVVNPFLGTVTTTWLSTLDYTLDNPFEADGLNPYLKEYDSTLMTTLTIEQNWRDRGVGRPEVNDVKFDIFQDGSEDAYIDHSTAVFNSDMGRYEFTVDNPAVGGESYTVFCIPKQQAARHISITIPCLSILLTAVSMTILRSRYFLKALRTAISRENTPTMTRTNIFQ